MTLKDTLTYTWEKPLFETLRDIYVRPESKSYKRNFVPKDRRRVLFTRQALNELGIPGYSSDLSMLLNTAFSVLGVRDLLEFFDINEMNERLKNENETEVKKTLREMGKTYYSEIEHVIPDDFLKAYDVLMTFYDLVLGSRHEDIYTPRPGFANYSYSEDTYPFEEATPSENAVWSFAQGAASMLHSKDGIRREMHETITRKRGNVEILSVAE